MSEHKAFASLSSGLLARKGSARPAMRRQGFGQVGPGGLDDLGWNDLGDPDYPDQDNEQAMVRLAQADQLEPLDPAEGTDGNIAEFKRNPISMLSPATSPVHDQRDEIERAFGYDESEEHYDGDDVYDETAEPWDGDEDDALNIDLGIGKSETPSFDEEPKLKRTVADLIPPAAAGDGAVSPLSDFSHLPTDLANFGKPAAPVEQPAAEDTQPEPEAFAPEIYEEVAPPEGFVPFAADDEADETPVAEDMPSVWDEPVEDEVAEAPVFEEPVVREEAEAEDEVVAQEPRFSGPLGPVLDALAASEEPAEPLVEEVAEEEEAPVAIAPKLPDFEPVPFETGAELDADDEQEEEPVAEAPVEEEPVVEEAEETPVAFDPVEFAPVEAEPVAIETPAVDVPQPIAASLDDVEPIASRSNAKGKAAFTLRLEQDVHLKLRLACALTGLSAQKYVSQALERALAEMPELDELAEKSAKSAE